MEVVEFLRENFVRLMALVCLLIGLADGARLLGVQSGSVNPLLELGLTGFVMLSLFTLARLFAAVGLWINSSWGGVLLIGATIVELGVVVSGDSVLDISLPSLVVRVALLVAILGFIGMRYLHHRRTAHD